MPVYYKITLHSQKLLYISDYPDMTKTIQNHQLPSTEPSGHRPPERYLVSPICTVHTRRVWISILRVKHRSKHLYPYPPHVSSLHQVNSPKSPKVSVSSEPPLALQDKTRQLPQRTARSLTCQRMFPCPTNSCPTAGNRH
jgi:hypothetical protein